MPNLFHTFLLGIYHIVIFVYFSAIKILAPFNNKAFHFINGRKNLNKRLQKEINFFRQKDSYSKIIWIHCASVGEFEQARPLIEQIKSNTSYKIFLTFFSPSGYNLRKNYKYADWVYYSPLDFPRNTKRFIDILKPEMAIFIKYEFWLNTIEHLHCTQIPIYVVSAIFKPNQIFFHPLASFYRKYLRMINIIFVQDKLSERTLLKHNINNVIISGDTRFDRVLEMANNNFEENSIARIFSGNNVTWVAGSTWHPDEEHIAKALSELYKSDKEYSKTKLILVPHEVDKNRIKKTETIFKDFHTIKYSECTSTDPLTLKKLQNSQVLIIDCIGILSSLYKYGSFAYIGGGFGVGIHNILEAACYKLPVIIGPNYHKFKEAEDLINLGAVISYKKTSLLGKYLSKYLDKNYDFELKELGELSSNYIIRNLGASNVILKELDL